VATGDESVAAVDPHLVAKSSPDLDRARTEPGGVVESPADDCAR